MRAIWAVFVTGSPTYVFDESSVLSVAYLLVSFPIFSILSGPLGCFWLRFGYTGRGLRPANNLTLLTLGRSPADGSKALGRYTYKEIAGLKKKANNYALEA
jgi:hypothetical protein